MKNNSILYFIIAYHS